MAHISYGTYTSDGVRVGPAFNKQNVTTPNPLASYSVFSGNNNLLSQGVLLAPYNTYNIVPATTASPNANVVALITTAGAGYLTLTQDNTATHLVVNPLGNTVCQFDWPRLVTLTSANDLHLVNITVKGLDYYGLPLQQTLAGPNANTVQTTKAFWTVTQVYTSNVVTAMSVGAAQDAFGLPYRINDVSYCNAFWNGAPFTTSARVVGVSAAMVGGTVTIPSAYVQASSIIQLTAQTTGAAPGALHISAIIPNVSFTVTSSNAGDTSTVGYLFTTPAATSFTTVTPNLNVNTGILLADQTPVATNATSDVRGVVVTPTNADGVKRLMVYDYVYGGDNWINQQAALNIPGQPAVNTYVPLVLSDLIGYPQYYTGLNA